MWARIWAMHRGVRLPESNLWSRQLSCGEKSELKFGIPHNTGRTPRFLY